MHNMTKKVWFAPLAWVVATALAPLFGVTVDAAAPGIKGSSFDLAATPGFISQPDGSSVYVWGYGCNSAASFAPTAIAGASCPTMQLPGPTLIVNEGANVTVTLHNTLPAAAGNTSILFPGFNVTAAGGTAGVLTQEAPVGGTVTYSFTADKPGTHAYYSGTQGDLQVEMGLYGAIIVLPTAVPTGCSATGGTLPSGETDFRNAAAAYDNPAACYDREYLFQFSEIDPVIHRAAEEIANCVSGGGVTCPASMNAILTEPYVPAYFMINGRSMPDDMDPNYANQYPNQPYNGNPHMHPGEKVLLRIVGQGRWQHPFHEHGNHVRMLGRDGNLLETGNHKLAGPLLFTTTTTPGQAMDGIYQWTGKGLNWDVYGHSLQDGSGALVAVGSTASALAGPTPSSATTVAAPWDATLTVWRRGAGTAANPYLYEAEPCFPDANGYYTTASSPPAAATAHNYYEWCQDHNKPLESKPFGQVGSGGPVTLPDPNILANGPWYGGSPYLGPDATARAVGSTPIPPSGTVANDPTSEAGFAFMWHSHNEREITTNNAFPGGMLMMMLVDPWVYEIDEAK